ncbi:MAG: response regulator transcription factor [Eubacterium sp.]|nr:response regulator transcription factor [Eubacterium sp.]
MKRIFIVEDEISICKELKELLVTEGYEADYIKSFDNTLEDIIAFNPDLVLLDINIPNLNGKLILRGIRKKSDVPVIMLTSKTEESDEVLSMSYGADDYITKPYNPVLLLLRISAVMRRMTPSNEKALYRGAEVDFSKGTIEKDGMKIVLTKNEMIIFQQLLNHLNQIVSRDDIMTNLWDNDEFINDNALTVSISRLRAKLAEAGFESTIETRKKLGYILQG